MDHYHVTMTSDFEKKLQALADAERERAKAAVKAELPELDPEMLLSPRSVREMRAASSSQFSGTFGRPKMPVIEEPRKFESTITEAPSFEFGEIEFSASADLQVDIEPSAEPMVQTMMRAVEQAIHRDSDARAQALLNREARLRQAGVDPNQNEDWDLGGDPGDAAGGPDLSSLFMNREAMQAQEALGAGSPFHMPMQDIDIEPEPRYRYASGSFGGGTVVSQRGEDGRFHATGAVVAAVRPVMPPSRPEPPPRAPAPPPRRPAPTEAPGAPAPTAFSRLGKDFGDF